MVLLIKDDLHRYVPSQWALLHPNLYGVALKAVSRAVAEVAEKDGEVYWRRLIDHPQMELGL